MAYKRVVQLDVLNNNTQIIQLANLDFEFSIERGIGQNNNSAQFIIYNCKENTRNNILRQGNNIVFRAGYEDEQNIASIFFGTITKTTNIKEDVNYVTTIEAVDIGANKTPLDYEPVAYSYRAGSPLIQIILDVKTALNIPVFGIENVTRTLNNGFCYSGTIDGLIKKINNILKQDNLAMYFDNSQMIIYQIGNGISLFGVVNISENSGLIGGIEVINDEKNEDGRKRVQLTSLLNPRLQPNGLISINTEKVSGIFFVEKLTHEGNTFGGDFFSVVEASE